MLNKKLKIILYLPLAIFFIANFFIFSSTLTSAADTGMPNLQIPDLNVKFSPAVCKTEGGKTICSVAWIGEYIAGIYKYAIGIVGILAAVVLMIGGVIWIVAGGSATAIGEAKAWIGASLTGLVIALCSYLILFQINPALTIFGPLGITRVEKTVTKTTNCVWQIFECRSNQTAGDPESCGVKPAENYKYCCCAVSIGKESAACSSRYKIGNVVSYNSIVDEKSPSTACRSLGYNFDSYGTSGHILRALAMTESSCNPTAVSPASACGLMQLTPATAQRYNSLATCDWLKANPQKSIEIASQFIQSNYSAHGGNSPRIFAGYNSGYSTSPNPTNGKKGGLAPSSDCPGNLAFECCINPGELAETQDHVFNSINYLNWIKAKNGY